MLLITACIFLFYNVINYVIMAVSGVEDKIPLGVEPLLFGLLCMGFDMLFIGMKRLCISIFRDAMATARSGK